MKNYQAQTSQNLALTIILQKIQENKHIPDLSTLSTLLIELICQDKYKIKIKLKLKH